MIVQEHFNKLLNLSPKYKQNVLTKLRKLHDEVEINVRSLSSLEIKLDSYSLVLTAIILKITPSNLTLEFNSQRADNTSTVDIFDLLKFIQKEIRARERSFSDRNASTKEPDPPPPPLKRLHGEILNQLHLLKSL